MNIFSLLHRQRGLRVCVYVPVFQMFLSALVLWRFSLIVSKLSLGNFYLQIFYCFLSLISRTPSNHSMFLHTSFFNLRQTFCHVLVLLFLIVSLSFLFFILRISTFYVTDFTFTLFFEIIIRVSSSSFIFSRTSTKICIFRDY